MVQAALYQLALDRKVGEYEQLQEPFTDESGNLFSRPVFDGDSNPVLCREAVARRDTLIEKLAALPPVPSALDQIVQHFGHEAVAEVTGRSRPASANLAETAAWPRCRRARRTSSGNATSTLPR